MMMMIFLTYERSTLKLVAVGVDAVVEVDDVLYG